MIKITRDALSPETVIEEVKNTASGCVISYVGLIRDNSNGKPVESVEYSDPDGNAEEGLKRLVEEIGSEFPINDMSFYHRIGKLRPGDINIIIAISAAHRGEAFAACQKTVNLFKEQLPTHKVETYIDGSTNISVSE